MREAPQGEEGGAKPWEESEGDAGAQAMVWGGDRVE
jgi:hypothetical protein